ncbi:sensor histidine kinase [Agrococcus jenensis]|uniref:histidine kinase n=1 Tax=Agrococcus jenensis TaxID=46353 RepID=A0A3N2AS53_9MICO|nr:HAMP domain-containing sensor histidine kinase [Agrococcus jenensis]ROR65870.1 signal transduction histidine kinase [Agrococcus jenensis]
MPDAPRSRLRTWTVRSRIVGLLTLLSLITAIAAGSVAYAVDRVRVLEQIDANLDAALDSVRFIVEGDDWSSTDEAVSTIVQRLAPDDNTGTLGIVDGEAAWQPGIAPDVPLEQLPGFVERIVAETADGRTVLGTYVEGTRSIRYLAAPVTVGEIASGPPRAVFVTGYDVEAELAELDGAARVFALTALLATAATFGIGLLVSGRLLRPIRHMREVAERASGADLSERIPVTGKDDVSQLAATVNGMLDRLGSSLEDQRQLLQDVGHELKTPITIVRGHLELVDPASPADVVETRELAIDELDRMARLVDDLRAAARLRDPAAFELRETDVAALVEQIAVKALAIDGADLDPNVEATPVVARLDPDRITQAMLQLAANAVRHARGPFSIGSRVRGSDLELFVRDRGPGVPDELKQVVFERFRRGAAEGRGDGGSGLGLSIVALIADRHGGRAWVADAGAGSEFILTLPGAIVPPAIVPIASAAAPSGQDDRGIHDHDHTTADHREQQWHRS